MQKFMTRAVYLMLAILLARASMLFAQISPGELSKVHAHLEGLSNCTKCHNLGEKVSGQKCLACHTEVKTRIDAGKGYHSSPAVKGKECVACHSDHHGRDFQIIRFDKDKFNHTLTGYPLQGAHAKKQCADCHKPAFIRDQSVRKKKSTFMGLPTDCLGCHEDYHQQTLSATCENCHNQEKFSPAAKFDHKKTRFVLEGRHATVSCASCHKVTTRNNKKFQEFRQEKLPACASCHQDPHSGKFGSNCSECHSGESFRSIKGIQNFDHNKTGFPLEGKHGAVACQQCHKAGLTRNLMHDRCSRCHADYHQGDFSKDGVSPDCSDCHTVKGFTGADFTLEKHEKSAFPLKGAHVATPCIACHKKSDRWAFRNIGLRCSDCHQDIHKPAISEKYYPGATCNGCHNEERWSSITFDHSTTKFPLDGSHVPVTCRECHFKTESDGKTRQVFAGLQTGCSACHADIHEGQFAAENSTDCSRCHITATFRPATKFSHASARFQLEGKHAQIPCSRCHPVVKGKSLSYVLYKTNQTKCEDCHR